MAVFRQLFVWWYGATLSTRFMTWRKGVPVGEDKYGNRYFESRDGKRRWVLYPGIVEASRVPPEWHGWMHHTFAKPPTEDPPKIKPWEADHVPNLSGTSGAYRPEGSLWKSGERPPATGDYEAWKPS